MTVGELIKELKKFDKDLEVVIKFPKNVYNDDYDYDSEMLLEINGGKLIL